MYNNPMTATELNSYVVALKIDKDTYYPPAKQWNRIDVGSIEAYVGDRLYVIAVGTQEHNNEEELDGHSIAIQKQVIKYLQSEGFLDHEYLYVGLQEYQL